MKCLYCGKKVDRYSLYSLFIEEDPLCIECRKKMSFQHKHFYLGKLKVESFYDYDSLFKSILLQYKECYDEALNIVFLHGIDLYIKIKYLGYQIIYVPSSQKKIEERGFSHLKLIFDSLEFKEVKGLKTKKELIQEGKDYQNRQLMKDNFFYEGPFINKVLIVDDVCTTGASLYGVYKALEGHSGKVKALVLSRKNK